MVKREHARFALVGLIVATSAALYSWKIDRHLGEIRQHKEGLDFHDYYFSAKARLEDKASIYNHAAMLSKSRRDVNVGWLPVYVYPPLLVVVFLPLAKLSYLTVRLGWLVLNQLFLGATVLACARLYQARTGRRVGLEFAVVFVFLAAAAFDPTLDHDWEGQSNLLVLALSAWALYAYFKPRRSNLAVGLLLAPAILLKLFPAVLLPIMLARRSWRALFWTGAAALAITAVSLIWIPWSDYKMFPHVLLDSRYTREGGPTLGNYSMAAGVMWFATWIGAHAGTVTKYATLFIRFVPYLAVVAAAAWEARRSYGLVPALRFSQAFVLIGFLMTTWWEHHNVFLIFPYFFALRAAMLEPVRARVAAVLVVISLLWVGLARHPLVWDWTLVGHPKLKEFRESFMQSKRIGILLLLVALEILIARFKTESRAETRLA
jgi:alpha-1,2-mannosyltransferase